MKLILLTFLFTLTSLHSSFAKDDYIQKCESPSFMQDLTPESEADARSEFSNNSDNPGFRIGWNDVKTKNKYYGLGAVNDVMCEYEKKVQKSFDSAEFKKAHPDVKVEFLKTDFKGYYISCTPQPSCDDLIKEKLQRIPPPEFEDKQVLTNSVVKSNNYQEGYIKSRMDQVYDIDLDNVNLSQFIDQEMRAAIKEATGSSDLKQLNSSDPEFMQELAKNIDEFRTNGMEKVDPKFKRLVQGLDTLLEIPYSSSSNIEKELAESLKSGEKISPNSRFSISSASSGDDLFVIIKDGDHVAKVLGADAKGLGVENMTARYTEFLDYTKDGNIDSMQDISKLSTKAIERADDKMEKSFDKYLEIVRQELQKPSNHQNIDEALKMAHEKYAKLAQEAPVNMVIRGGTVSECGDDVKCIMNRTTVIHNNLKTMEAAGITTHFGTSCLSTEYWLLKMGLKAD